MSLLAEPVTWLLAAAAAAALSVVRLVRGRESVRAGFSRQLDGLGDERGFRCRCAARPVP